MTSDPHHRADREAVSSRGLDPSPAPGGVTIPIVGEAVDRPSWADRGDTYTTATLEGLRRAVVVRTNGPGPTDRQLEQWIRGCAANPPPDMDTDAVADRVVAALLEGSDG